MSGVTKAKKKKKELIFIASHLTEPNLDGKTTQAYCWGIKTQNKVE